MEQSWEDILITWQDIKPLVTCLYSDYAVTWGVKLKTATDKVDTAFACDDSNKAKLCFRRYRSEVNRIFNRVDTDLLAMCESLQKIGGPLAQILRMMQNE